MNRREFLRGLIGAVAAVVVGCKKEEEVVNPESWLAGVDWASEEEDLLVVVGRRSVFIPENHQLRAPDVHQYWRTLDGEVWPIPEGVSISGNCSGAHLKLKTQEELLEEIPGWETKFVRTADGHIIAHDTVWDRNNFDPIEDVKSRTSEILANVGLEV